MYVLLEYFETIYAYLHEIHLNIIWYFFNHTIILTLVTVQFKLASVCGARIRNDIY